MNYHENTTLSCDANLSDPQLAMPGIRGLSPYQPGKSIATLQREYGVKDALKLASNENPLGPGSKAREAVLASLDQLSQYPDGGGGGLKEALADRYSVSPNCITLGNGSNDILDLLARVFLGPNRAALFSEYAFAVYSLVTQAVGAQPVIAPAHNGTEGTCYGHNVEAMLRRLNKRVRLVFIANPNNPTGTWLTKKELYTFIQAVPRHVLVVVDEAYFEYVEEAAYPDGTLWLPEFPNLIITRTFSKAFGLAGLRCGYALSNPKIAELLNRVRQPFNVSLPALVAAQAALTDQAHLEETQRTNQAALQQLSQGFTSLGLTAIPSVANFICLQIPKPVLEVNERMLKAGVIVRPLANYGLPMHLRITTGTERQNRRLLRVLAQALK